MRQTRSPDIGKKSMAARQSDDALEELEIPPD
jgi:hypothetical protein